MSTTMRVTVTVRLMGSVGELLGWGNAQMDAGNGQLTPVVAAEVEIERAGVLTEIIEHWADLDVRRQTTSPALTPVVVGQRLSYTPPPWAFPTMDVRLAPVTLKQSVAIGVATGGVGARTS